MGTVQGNVVIRETQLGVAGAIVVASAATDERGDALLRRLGSAVTGSGGRFDLEYELPSDLRCAWDLVVTVHSPDDGGGRERPTSLASARREDAAGQESFQFRIAEAALVEAGLTAERTELTADELIEREKIHRQFQQKLDTERKRLVAAGLSEALQVHRAADEYFTKFTEALSDADGGRPGSRYVPPGASVSEASLSAVRDGVTDRINQLGVNTVGVLDEQQLARLQQQYGQELSNVPARELDQMLRPYRGIELAGPVHYVLPEFLCRRHEPINDCVKILDPERSDDHHDEPQPPPPRTPQPPEQPVTPTTKDLVGQLIETITPPESRVSFGVRPQVGDIQANVDGFALRSGPADVPATYDFHRLDIAFESVWQELFDKDALETGHQLYEKFVELGLDPNQYLLDSTGKPDGKPIKQLGKAPVEGSSPPPEVTQSFEITQREWQALDTQHQTQLKNLATELSNAKPDPIGNSVLELWEKIVGENASAKAVAQFSIESRREANEIRAQAARIIRYAKAKLQAPRDFDQFHSLLDQLNKSLKEPYRFNIYAAGHGGRSVNFGVVATYRQQWTPVTYQVGELVRAVPLAPKESRKYTRRLVRKLSRAEKESTSRLESLRTETSVTARVEAEIVARAQTKTNFETGAEAGIDLGVKLSGSAKFGANAEESSQETKKEFHESVFKAASEYKSEHRVEVDVSAASEFTDEESGELTNPNDELPVTYLFYELQRRYRVEEKPHKVTPVILVAQEFPRPDEIDDDWIVAHDWILRRVILDASFIPALNYLSSKVVGDEHALNEMYATLQQQRGVLDKLTEEVAELRSQVDARYEALQRSVQAHAAALEAEGSEGILEAGHELLFGSDELDPEAMKAREAASRDAYQRLVEQERELTARLQRETTAVRELTEKYTAQLSEHLNRRTQISRLRVHLKANIFHYMQAIYSYEPPDQRYFRLRDVQVPRLVGKKTYSITTDPNAVPLPPTWKKPHKLTAHVDINPNNLEFDSLGDIADLDNPLGFKGNYMMFPLKQGNALTDFMMTPYYDPFTGMRDPDQLGNWTLHDFAEYVCCLREHAAEPQHFERYLPGLIETYRRLKERHDDGSELVVPTGSLYIEALPGAHPILEDFKLAHRATDVKKAQAEVRLGELENLRMAARIQANEYEDPRVDKKIIIEGLPGVSIDPDNT